MKFKDYRKIVLDEAVKAGDTTKVAKLIQSYLYKKLGAAYLYPSIEQFKHGSDVYTAVTILLSSTKYIHFNWLHGKIDQNSLHSVVISDMGQHEEIKFDKNVSLVQVLPQIVSILQGKIKTPEFEFYMEDFEITSDEYINEAREENPMEVVKGYLGGLKPGDKIVNARVWERCGNVGIKLLKQIMVDNPKSFSGNQLINKNINWHGAESVLSNSRVKGSITKDNTKETWVNPGIDEEEAQEQISYIEKIEDLSNMLKFMMKGATNAVFVAGRGGCLHSNTEINIEI